MKRTLLFLVIVVTVFCSICGYYFWCAYHPNINISIGRGSSVAENLKIDTPVFSVSGKWYADPSPYIMLDLTNLILQHEYIIQYVKDNFKESDIRLDISETNNQTVLSYTGTAITKDDQEIEFSREIILEHISNANIS